MVAAAGQLPTHNDQGQPSDPHFALAAFAQALATHITLCEQHVDFVQC